MSQNNITLFSNGMGHFSRVYDVEKKEVISIPFDKQHIGDVAASLQVFGSVRLSAPPSFAPSNSELTSLNVDSSNALYSLLSSLSGTSVTLADSPSGEKRECTLLGTERRNEWRGDTFVENMLVVTMDSDGFISKKPLEYVGGVRFNDEAVRLEVEKALKKNFEKIKPDSTFLEITLEAKEQEESTSATVQYTVPVAAWKMRYSIRQKNGKFTLEGAAVIDNNTDEDWNDFTVSVVTGNPVSFKTDIADVVVPQRKTIRIIDGQVLSNVQVQDVVAACDMGGSNRTRNLRSAAGAKFSQSNYKGFGLPDDDDNSAMQFASGEGNLEMFSEGYIAEATEIDSKEVGDFCVFTSKEPITILARRSAVVPMFVTPLKSAAVILHYKESNHSRRPYRAVKFRNESTNTLGRGKTVIYQDGVFSGECILETSKPGETRTLPHCLENGVKVVKKDDNIENKRQSLRLSEGVAFDEYTKSKTTTYIVENRKDEKFKMMVEYDNVLGDNSLVNFLGADTEIEKTEKGYHVYFDLEPKAKVVLEVNETVLVKNSISLHNNFNWIVRNIIKPDEVLSDNKDILEAASIQRQMDLLDQEIEEIRERRSELVDQKDRIREDLMAAKEVTDVTVTSEWVVDLKESEKEIREIDNVTIPEKNKLAKELKYKLEVKISEISADWTCG